MLRAITRFDRDVREAWVAELDCYHRQHVHHRPPFIDQPWIATPAGRDGMIGATLDCVRCDRLELPEGLEAYKRTPDFGDADIPNGLLKNHTTKPGTWGLITVTNGTLVYEVQLPQPRRLILTVGVNGAIPPGLRHHVEAAPGVKFFVGFYRKATQCH